MSGEPYCEWKLIPGNIYVMGCTGEMLKRRGPVPHWCECGKRVKLIGRETGQAGDGVRY